MRTIFTPVLAAALVAAPAAAQAGERTAASFEQGERIAGNPWIPLLVGLAVAIAIAVVVFDDDDDEAVSP
ncbi:hypothetical protein GRI75_06235 [Altererythrobacter soli]|uniref:Ferrochelatase n=1 Tax=Croceibacterium soli TaxID=1739690 RepID=A0A6I4UQI6_9SPHN|nr:hypothetical protein [Croceibacterium soli]MXP41240.1 hypothetical protein [Croceibacterium soli]